MGYHTEFVGEVYVNKPLDSTTRAIIDGLNRTRRVKRNIRELAKIHGMALAFAKAKWGEHGELYFTKDEKKDSTVIDYNKPPANQPSLYCCWKHEEYDNTIIWDGSEKFESYIEWMKYLINEILAPRGYTLHGEIEWYGEDRDDRGRIVVKNNKIKIKEATITWSDSDESEDESGSGEDESGSGEDESGSGEDESDKSGSGEDESDKSGSGEDESGSGEDESGSGEDESGSGSKDKSCSRSCKVRKLHTNMLASRSGVLV